MWAYSAKSASVRTRQWTQVTQLGEAPPAITQFAYTTHRNAEGRQQFVVCRGLGLLSEVDDIYRSVTNSFDVLSRTWKVYPSKGSSPKAEADAAVAYFDNSLYYFGGVKAEDNINPSLADDKLYHYDLTMQTWRVLSVNNPPPSRNLFGMAVYQETLYVFQGWSNLLSNQLTVFKLKLKAEVKSWELVEYSNAKEDQNLPHDSYGFDFKGSWAYFSCGWNVSNIKNNIVKADLSKPEPITFEIATVNYDSPSARMNHQLVTIGTKLVLFGGENNTSK